MYDFFYNLIGYTQSSTQSMNTYQQYLLAGTIVLAILLCVTCLREVFRFIRGLIVGFDRR